MWFFKSRSESSRACLVLFRALQAATHREKWELLKKIHAPVIIVGLREQGPMIAG